MVLSAGAADPERQGRDLGGLRAATFHLLKSEGLRAEGNFPLLAPPIHSKMLEEFDKLVRFISKIAGHVGEAGKEASRWFGARWEWRGENVGALDRAGVLRHKHHAPASWFRSEV